MKLNKERSVGKSHSTKRHCMKQIKMCSIIWLFPHQWSASVLRARSHDPGTTHCPGQVTDPRVNFASVHGLMPVTVHMSFLLPRGDFERRVTCCTTPGNPPCPGNFSPYEQNAKVAPGQE